jgi:hypothetical protein
MLLASYYSGMCIAASGTTGVHALSYPIGGVLRVPHGVANSMFFVPVFGYNLPAEAERISRLAAAAGLAPEEGYESREAHAKAFVRVLYDTCARQAFGVKRLLDNNPRAMSVEDIAAVCRPVVIGAAAVMAAAVREFAPRAILAVIPEPSRGRFEPGRVNLMDLVPVDMAQVTRGAVCAESGRAAFTAVADIIDTYVYRIGLSDVNYSFATAVGLFRNLVGVILVYGTERLAKRLGQSGLW